MTSAKRKTLTRSVLEKIEGIGPKKARVLLKAMPLGRIRESTPEELSAISGISERDAQNIYAYYHKR